MNNRDGGLKRQGYLNYLSGGHRSRSNKYFYKVSFAVCLRRSSRGSTSGRLPAEVCGHEYYPTLRTRTRVSVSTGEPGPDGGHIRTESDVHGPAGRRRDVCLSRCVGTTTTRHSGSTPVSLSLRGSRDRTESISEQSRTSMVWW